MLDACPVCKLRAREINVTKKYTAYRCANKGECDAIQWKVYGTERDMDLSTLHIFNGIVNRA